MTSMIKLTAATLIAAGLAACGGGGNAVSTSTTVGDTASDQLADIGTDADSLSLSALGASSADGEENVEDVNCDEQRCTPLGNDLSAQDLIDSVNGGTADQVTVTIGNVGAPALMRSAFGVGDLMTDSGRHWFGWALGSRAGSRPETSGTYSGKMTGVTVSEGVSLRGNAELTYRFTNSGGELSAIFSDIERSSDGTAYSSPRIQFPDVEVSETGTFQKGNLGNRIQGAFYGSNRGEIAGTFEKPNIRGAYGVRSSSQ